MSMWGRLSTIGANLSEFTKEVIAADESDEDDDHQFFDEDDSSGQQHDDVSIVVTSETPQQQEQQQQVVEPIFLPKHVKSKSLDSSIHLVSSELLPLINTRPNNVKTTTTEKEEGSENAGVITTENTVIQLPETVENDLKTNENSSTTSIEVCNVFLSMIQSLLKNEFKSNLTIPIGESVSQTLINAADVLQHATRETVQMNDKLMIKLSQLQADQLKLVEENTENERKLQMQLDVVKREKARDLAKVVEDSSKQLAEKDRVIEKLNRELYDSQNRINQTMDTYHALQRKHASLESSMHKSNEFFEYQKEEQEEEKQHLYEQIKSLQLQIEQYQEREKQGEQKKQQLLNEVGTLNRKIQNHAEEVKRKEEALSSLETVLEQMQADSVRDVTRLKHRISELEETTSKAEREAEESKVEHDEFIRLKEENQQVRIEMKEKTKYSESVAARFEAMKTMLEDAIGRVNDENLVDRRVVSRLLLTLCDPSTDLVEPSSPIVTQLASESSVQRQEKIVTLLCNTLRMNEEGRKIILNCFKHMQKYVDQVVPNTQGGGGFGWFRRNNSIESYNSSSARERQKSLSQLWVQFLLAESEKDSASHHQM